MHERSRWIRAGLILLLAIGIASVASPTRPPVHAQGGGTLGYGAKVSGRVSAEMPEVLYSFNGTAGDLIQVQARNWVGTLDPQVTLLAPDGQTLATSTRSPLAAENRDAYLSLWLPQTGVYMLAIAGEDGTSGQFLLTLQGRGQVSIIPLLPGQGLDVAIPQNPSPQYFAFDAADCPTVLTVANLSEGEPFTFPFAVKVRNPQGGLIAVLYGGDAVEDRLVVPPQSGRYEVEVLSEDPEVAGTIHLLVNCSGLGPGCVASGVPGGPADVVTGAPTDCPPCFDETFGGELCDTFELTATHEGDGAVLFSWPAVEGAEWYIFSIVDAMGTLLADSPILLEGSTSHTYIFDPADVSRGPFTASIHAGSGTEIATSLCIDTVEVSFEGEITDMCSGIAVGADIVPGDDRRVVLSWTEAPGAAAYLIHVYAYSEDGGLIGIRVLVVPGDARTFHLEDVFPADYYNFHLVVDAYEVASGGGAFGDMPTGYLCSGGTDVEFPKTGPVEWGPGV